MVMVINFVCALRMWAFGYSDELEPQNWARFGWPRHDVYTTRAYIRARALVPQPK